MVLQQCRESHRLVPTGCYAYAFKPHRRAFIPARGPVRGGLADVSLGYAPFLHDLRRVIPFVRRFLWYYGRIRLLTGVNDRVMALGLACHARACGSGTDEISQLPCRSLPDMLRISDRAGLKHGLRLASCFILPSDIAMSWASRLMISRLYGWPAGLPCQRFAPHLAACNA